MGSGYLWCYMDPRLYSTQGLLLRCWNGPFLSGKSNKIQPKISRQIQQITGGYKTEEHSTHVCANFLTINRSATSTKLCQQRINFLLLYCFFFLNSISRSRGFLLLFSQSQHENKQIFFSAGGFELAEVIEVIVFFFFLNGEPKIWNVPGKQLHTRRRYCYMRGYLRETLNCENKAPWKLLVKRVEWRNNSNQWHAQITMHIQWRRKGKLQTESHLH